MDTIEILKAASTFTYGDSVGQWLYDTWQEHNAKHFDDLLPPIAIQIALTPYGKAVGLCQHVSNRLIVLHPGAFGGSVAAGWTLDNKRFAADVLLHEMMHQAIYQRHGHNGHIKEGGQWSGTSSHNNDYWTAELNRIAPALNLKVKAETVRQRRIKQGGGGSAREYKPCEGCLTMSEIGGFPHLLTSPAYYQGLTDTR